MSAPGELAISQVWNLGFLERYQKGRLNLLRVIGPTRRRDRLSGSLIFNYRGEESIPTRVPDQTRGLAGKRIESLMAGSPEGVFQIDDSAKRAILTNIE